MPRGGNMSTFSAVSLQAAAPSTTLQSLTLPSSEILAVKNLTVSFDGFKAVDNLSMSIAEKELRVIIGPNGAGKTTLLDMICGKTKPSSGSIKFNNTELRGRTEPDIVKLGVGRKFQT